MMGIVSALREAWLVLAGHLWQTTLVVGLFFLLERVMRRAPARLRCALWSVAFLKLLLPLAICGRIGQAALLALRPDLLQAHPAGNGAALAVLTGIMDPVTGWGLHAFPVTVSSSVVPVVLTVAWVVGTGWGLRNLVRAQTKARDLKGVPFSRVAGASRDRLAQALCGTPIPHDRLEITDEVPMPCVVGLLRPRILLPPVLVSSLEEQELRGLLLHEEAHRRRLEPLRSAVFSFFSSLYFFYPLLGPLGQRLRQSAELACDERVLRFGIQPQTYARALAISVKTGLAPAVEPLTAAAHGGSYLQARFQRLRTSGRRSAMSKHYVALVLAILLVAVGTVLPLPMLTGCADETRVARDASAPKLAQTEEGLAAEVDSIPVLLDIPSPTYPPEARRKGIEGTVMVRALVGSDGSVQELFVVEGVPELDAAALDAVHKATFRPSVKDGKNSPVWVQIPVRFALK